MSGKSIYYKFSNDRDPRFGIVTQIISDQGEKYVVKEPADPAAEPHVRAIVKNGESLREYYRGSRIRFAQSEWTGSGVRIEWVQGRSFAEYLDELLEKGDADACLRLMEEYFEQIFSGRTRAYQCLPDSEIYYDAGAAAESVEAVSGIDVDMLFQNVIYSEAEHIWTDYDYEWVLSCDIPVKFLVYRCLSYYLTTDLRIRLLGSNVYEYFHISAKDMQCVKRMEEQLQSYIRGGSVPLWVLLGDMAGPIIQVPPMAEHKINVRQAQIYYNSGNGFFPDKMKPVRVEEFESGRFRAKLEYPAETQEIRFDPVQSGCMMKILSLTDERGNNLSFQTNGTCCLDEEYIFLHDDPQILVKTTADTGNVNIIYSLIAMDADDMSGRVTLEKCHREMLSREAELARTGTLLTDLRRQNGEQQRQNEELQRQNEELQTDLAEQKNRNEDLKKQVLQLEGHVEKAVMTCQSKAKEYKSKVKEYEASIQNYQSFIDSLTGSTSWKLTGPFRKIGNKMHSDSDKNS